MAGVLTQSNSFRLTGMIGRRPSDSELYMAHFMGVGGAAKLITKAEDSPNLSGAALFPNAAAANRSIFYDRSGSARSVSEVYAVLNARYAGAANSPATRTAMAALGGSSAAAATTVAAAAPSIDNAAYLSSFPDLRTAAATPTTAASNQNEPMFRTLFQGGDRAEPVSPAVQELWGNRTSLTQAAASGPTIAVPKPLDLFSDRSGAFSS
jgi:hypothetical protein